MKKGKITSHKTMGKIPTKHVVYRYIKLNFERGFSLP